MMFDLCPTIFLMKTENNLRAELVHTGLGSTSPTVYHPSPNPSNYNHHHFFMCGRAGDKLEKYDGSKSMEALRGYVKKMAPQPTKKKTTSKRTKKEL